MFVRLHGLGGGDVARQHLVQPRAVVARQPEPGGRVALRVRVDEQRLVAGLGDAGRHVDGGGGLAHPALLVRDRVNGAHDAFEISGLGGCRTRSTGVLRPFPVAADTPPAWARSCERRAKSAAPSPCTARPHELPPARARAPRRHAARRPPPARRPRPSTPPATRPPAAAAPRTRTAPAARASARAVTTSNGASSSSSARAHATRTFSSPSASTVRSSHAHFFPTLSTRHELRLRPRDRQDEPRQAGARAEIRRWAAFRSPQLEADQRIRDVDVDLAAGSCTDVGASGSASRLRRPASVSCAAASVVARREMFHD